MTTAEWLNDFLSFSKKKPELIYAQAALEGNLEKRFIMVVSNRQWGAKLVKYNPRFSTIKRKSMWDSHTYRR